MDEDKKSEGERWHEQIWRCVSATYQFPPKLISLIEIMVFKYILHLYTVIKMALLSFSYTLTNLNII